MLMGLPPRMSQLVTAGERCYRCVGSPLRAPHRYELEPLLGRDDPDSINIPGDELTDITAPAKSR
jgi:hypothetical protein